MRLAFVVNAGLDYLDVHLDDVSVKISTLPPPTYDVYFGTNPTPGAPQLLGSTTNTYWALPQLAPFTTYYWQIVARRAQPDRGAGLAVQFPAHALHHQRSVAGGR